SYVTKGPANTSLPKSRTLGSLLASSRELTPSGRLMKPIQPPLPRSQTLGNISCLNHSALTPSPRKPTQAIPDGLRSYYNSQNQLDGSKVFQGSRMAEKEMRFMTEVQREAAANCTRMRNALGKVPVALRTPISLKSRISDVPASDDRFLPPTSGVGRAPDSDLSNLQLPGATFTNRSLESPPYTQVREAADTLNHVPKTPSSREEVLSPKDVSVVCQAETIPYWTGRFVGVCDRLKMEEFNTRRSFPGPADNKSVEAIWDSREKLIIDTAVIELTRHCKTTEALKSLTDFETRLLQDVGRSRNHTTAQLIGHRLLAGHTGLPKPSGSYSNPTKIWIAPSSPKTATSTTSGVSSINAEATLAAGPKLFYGRGGMAKSKTTGHLASLIPMIQARSRSIAPTPRHIPQANTAESSSHRRKTSYFDCSPETRALVWKEREDRAARRVAEVRGRLEARLLS
ncbi:uncharacterized protein A1O9_00203, partial [Exophiala aquamarina CBS 119918]